MERVIAAEIGLDPQTIWPERYRKGDTSQND
jgi:lambda repressor-like predicted transcriptional regulator